jgi:hypothetical protein
VARGRLILRTLGSSRKFAAVPSHAGKLAEFAQALYQLLVTHTDDYGRLAGDAFTVKHAVFPTSPRKESEFSAALGALRSAGLIHWYEVPDGRQVIQIVDFGKGQPNLHKRSQSGFPEYSEDYPDVPGFSRRVSDSPTQLNVREENLTELSHARVKPDVDRVRNFVDRYRELHEQYIGVAYLGNPGADYQEACTLVATFDDAMLEKLTVYWLNDRDKFATDGTRTIAKLRSRASKYAEELKAKKLA